MKKLIFIFAICFAFACKKNNNSGDSITNNNWTLTSATISPGIMHNGKLETNYITIFSSCLGYGSTLNFLNNGTYTINSHAPACDYWNSAEQTYTKNGNEIKLTSNGKVNTFNLIGNELRNTDNIQLNNTSQTIEYVYTRQPK